MVKSLRDKSVSYLKPKPCDCKNCYFTKLNIKGYPCLITEGTPSHKLPNAVQPKFDWPRNEREEVLHKEIDRLNKEVEKGVKTGMLVGVIITSLVAYLIL